MKELNGIELLKLIKDNKLKNNTKIEVLYDDGVGCYTRAILNYIDGELNWEPGTFKVPMLYDDDYFFEIIGGKPKDIDLYRETIKLYDVNNLVKLKIKTFKYLCSITDKLNETIKTINYLLKKEDD